MLIAAARQQGQVILDFSRQSGSSLCAEDILSLLAVRLKDPGATRLSRRLLPEKRHALGGVCERRKLPAVLLPADS